MIGLKGKIAYWAYNYAVLLLGRLYLDARWYHPDRFPDEGPVILASNHLSYLDPMIGCVLPRICYYVAHEHLYENRLMSWYLPTIGSIKIDTRTGGRQGMREAKRYLSRGEPVVIFPEGTRSEGRLMKGSAGAVKLACDSGAPILPIGICGTDKALGRGMKWPHKAKVRIRYGELIHLDPPEEYDEDRPPVDYLRDRTHLIMSRIGSLLPEDYQPEDPDEVYGSYADEVVPAPSD